MNLLKNIILITNTIFLFFVYSQNINGAEEINSIHLNSNHSKLNGLTGMFEHCGNAVLKQKNLMLKADCLIGKKSKNGKFEYIIAKGNPAKLSQLNDIKQESLNVTANIIEYKVPVQQFLISQNAILKLSNNKEDSLEINAHKIRLNNQQEQSQKIEATGNLLKIELVKSGNMDLKAQSKSLKYNTGTSKLILSKDVTAELELGQITAGIFKYNSETKESSFERSNKEQIEIIQTKKKP
jgi:lipopolysaccharide transport protein LptA